MLSANTFQELVGKSPLPSLEHHLALVVDCAKRIPVSLQAASSRPDPGQLKVLRFEVLELAQQAELVQAELVRDWPKGLLVPIRRRDLVLVLESQEQIVDASRQIASFLQLPLELPTEINRLMLSLAERGVKTCSRALRVAESLEAVTRTGLKGPDLSSTYGLVNDVRQSGQQARALSEDIRASVHERCRDKDAVCVVFVLELTRLLGDLSRYAERAATRALLLVTR